MYDCRGLVALNESTSWSFPGAKWRRSRSISLAKRGFCILSMGNHTQPRYVVYGSSRGRDIPIFVMMPKDTFGIDSSGTPRIRRIKALTMSLKALKLAGVHGIAVEVWWGLVERSSPFSYNWFMYEELFKLILELGLKLHVALAFHSSVHTSCGTKNHISLPPWVLKIGGINKDVYYRDQHGICSNDYLTLGVDHVPLFCGRTALQCYEDFMLSFVTNFRSLMGSTIEEVSIGLGPSGELRYPAHPVHDGRWRFPGIGEFQCYDKYMMEDLRQAAYQLGKPEWAEKKPESAHYYNSHPSEVPFFEDGEENFLSDYGHFFLDWYSAKLIQHADAVLASATSVFKNNQDGQLNSVLLVAKVGGVHWWYRTPSHAAELTAGYYNTATRDGYDPLGTVLSRHRAALHIPCLEMLDNETPRACCCSPEGLLEQAFSMLLMSLLAFPGKHFLMSKMQNVARKKILFVTGRNATERLDKDGLCRIITNSRYSEADCIRSFTYWSMNEKIFQFDNWNNFVLFVKKMSNRR
ncbi:inactive beta-amylase 4, chloroplastic isoform X2 [Nymphaea colorata]|uniref:inactive beta-amylase 4, chloroplastic isoform X2 n=1 Tax=Nymphaea colorata TaxID=210225 RepID=UPI00129EFD76|nr:inactive beta-amylase 4, chloroplastic isoform X2 [Nymphaea colorata]